MNSPFLPSGQFEEVDVRAWSRFVESEASAGNVISLPDIPPLMVARDYVRRGWSCFPTQGGVGDRSKRPALSSWKEFQTRLPTEDEVTSWWEAGSHGIAIVTGPVSGVVVLDIDTKDGADPHQVLADLERRIGVELPRTRTHKTQSGGLHLIFATNEPIKNNARTKLGDNLDIRGDGGYVCAPGSPGYEVVSYVEPAPLPDALAKAMRGEQKPKTIAAPIVAARSKATPRSLLDACGKVREAKEGERNQTLNAQAFVVGTLVRDGYVEEDDARDALVEAGLAAGLMQTETEATVSSGLTAGMAAAPSKPEADVGRELVEVVERISSVLARIPSETATVFRSGGYVTKDGTATLDRLAVELSRHIAFVRADKVAHPPEQLIKRWASVVDDRIPELVGRWQGPLLRSDGSVRAEAGYDAASRMLVDGWSGPGPGDTKTEAEAARDRLMSFAGSRFDEDVDGLAWLAHVLTIAARPAISGAVPVWVYSSSATGSGKTTLARCAGKIGGLCDAWTEPGFKNDDELARKLDEHATRPAVVLDNLRGTFASQVMEGAVTNGALPVRRLYVGHATVAWRCVMSITSNGAQVGPDWLRRIIPVRLSPRKPDAGRDMLAEVTPQMTADAVTIVRAWLMSGDPATHTSLASFAEWSHVVCGALMWLGMGDLVAMTRETADDVASVDDGSSEKLDAIEAWAQGREFTAKELWAAVSGSELAEAFDDVLSVRGLGIRLGGLHDATRATARRKSQGVMRWRVVRR